MNARMSSISGESGEPRPHPQGHTCSSQPDGAINTEDDSPVADTQNALKKKKKSKVERERKPEALHTQYQKANISAAARILETARQSLFTESVHMVVPKKQRHRKLQHQQHQLQQRDVQDTASRESLDEQPRQKPSQASAQRVQVVTTCRLQMQTDATASGDGDGPTVARIYVKPLLVLDLNGILCHRIRRPRGTEQVQPIPMPMRAYRPQLGPNIAMTPIIPRPDLHSFLEYLDQHFCLAVWTSAKAKTAKALVKLLVPDSVARKLLFVWSQNHCQVDGTLPPALLPNDTASAADETAAPAPPLAPSEIVYKKNLEQAWKAFPLWNRTNTLLMDDSPDKCVAWEENAIHPPPLHGRRRNGEFAELLPPPPPLPHGNDDLQSQKHSSSSSSATILALVPSDDEVNVAKQREFFERLVRHWNEHPTAHNWDSETDDAIVSNGEGHLRFLEEHAVGHMGWHP